MTVALREITEPAAGPPRLSEAWRTLGHRIAAAGGSLVALLSLLSDATIPTACVRGACTLLSVLVVIRLGTFALEHASALDASGSTRPGGSS